MVLHAIPKMNVVVLSSVILILCALVSFSLGAYNTQNEWEIKKFRAVTSSKELVNFYLRSRQTIANHDTRPQESEKPQKRKHIKKEICKNIFTSPFFDRLSEQWVNVELDTVRQKLQTDHSMIYDAIFRTPEPHVTSISSSASRTARNEYRNPYQRRRTAYLDLNSVVAYEYVFLCVVSESATGLGSEEYKEYYVSREYNVNSYKGAYPIVGRFIFSLNALNELEVDALAEESGISWNFYRRIKMIESMYLWKRNDTPLVVDPERDPVCSLSEIDKIRLCAIFFGAPMFERKGLRFIPQRSYVQTECEKRRVKIRTPVFVRGIRIVTRAFMNAHRGNEELVIGCEASGRHPKTYFLAHGAHYNTIFAFKVAKRNQHLENPPLTVFGYFDNVSVVGDVTASMMLRSNEQGGIETTPRGGETSQRRTEMGPFQTHSRTRWEWER